MSEECTKGMKWPVEYKYYLKEVYAEKYLEYFGAVRHCCSS